jgi:hypothetical protein
VRTSTNPKGDTKHFISHVYHDSSKTLPWVGGLEGTRTSDY